MWKFWKRVVRVVGRRHHVAPGKTLRVELIGDVDFTVQEIAVVGAGGGAVSVDMERV